MYNIKGRKNMKTKIFYLILVLVVMSNAKSLYITTEGNDAVTYASNDFAHPWLSYSKAFYEPFAGDTVFVRKGIYNISTKIDQYAAYGHNGTASKPIVVTNYPGDSVTITADIGLNAPIDIERDFYTVDGFSFIGPGKFFRIGWDYSGANFTLQNFRAKMIQGGDNFGFVYVDGAANCTVKNGIIEGIFPAGTDAAKMTAGVVAFIAPGFKVLNCEIHHTKLGIYYKHANPPVQSGIVFAYNFIHETEVSSIESNANFAYIHDNVIGVNNAQFKLDDANGGPGGDFNILDHNTLFSAPLVLKYDTSPGDPNPGALGNTVTNNLFMQTTEYHTYSPVPHNTKSGRNMYAPGAAIIENRVKYSLADFKAHSGQENSSFVGAPIFQVTSPVSLAQFKLAAGSPGLNADGAGRDVGANIPLVGPQGIKSFDSSQKIPTVYTSEVKIGGIPDTIFCPGTLIRIDSVPYPVVQWKHDSIPYPAPYPVIQRETLYVVPKAFRLVPE